MATLPLPTEGLVIRYSYLWRTEHLAGLEDGSKDRPCAIVLLVSTDENPRPVVTVLPITHSPPGRSQDAIEIPALTKERLGLDDKRSWVVLTEANQFRWPGPDLRRIDRTGLASVAYGYLPEALYEKIRLAFIDSIRRSPHSLVTRTE